MSLAESIRFDLIQLIEDDPAYFHHKKSSGTYREYRGSSSGLNMQRPLEVGGFEEQPQLTIATNLKNATGDNVFGQDSPEVGDYVRVNGVEYRITRTEIDSFRECLQMDLGSKNK